MPLKIKARQGGGGGAAAEEEEEEPLDFASDGDPADDPLPLPSDGGGGGNADGKPAEQQREQQQRRGQQAAALGAAAAARLQRAAGRIKALNPAKAAAAYDLESQEVARRAAGKEAVKRALAGALLLDGGGSAGGVGAAAADPFAPLDDGGGAGQCHTNRRPGGFWRVRAGAHPCLGWSGGSEAVASP